MSIGMSKILYYGNTVKAVEVAGYGVKVLVNDKGDWYYSVQDMLDAAGENFKKDVYARFLDYGMGPHLMKHPEARFFYYGDLKAMDVLLNQILGTDRAKKVFESIRMR